MVGQKRTGTTPPWCYKFEIKAWRTRRRQRGISLSDFYSPVQTIRLSGSGLVCDPKEVAEDTMMRDFTLKQRAPRDWIVESHLSLSGTLS